MTTKDSSRSQKDPIEDLTRIVLDMQTMFEAEFGKLSTKQDLLALKQDLISGRLNQIDVTLKEHSSKHHQGLDLLDGIAGRIKDDEVERVALSAQVTRHEDWLVENAPTLGVTYAPGA